MARTRARYFIDVAASSAQALDLQRDLSMPPAVTTAPTATADTVLTVTAEAAPTAMAEGAKRCSGGTHGCLHV